MKILKSFLALALVLSFTWSSVSKVKAESTIIASQQENLEELEKLVGKDVTMEVMSNSEKEYIDSKLSDISSVNNFEDQLKKEKFKKQKVENEKTSYKYSIADTNETVYMTSDVYESKDEMVVTFTQYNAYNDEISLFYAEKRSTVNSDEEPETLIEYTPQVKDKSDMVSTADFTWNGKSFACSATGVLACGQYCGVWALVNPVAGGTCTVVCGLAFAAACSMG
ncbi:putative immunity/bacteriocin fusion bifunctional protein [Salinicoccus roseus]|uniref:Uncharacterized protein n=1 Tax=Salinicoccus roseus TaxID=45670 RepID=A0A265E4N0_9STAP|nr:putative immunity/bacteriocin fusion bifunctional protein [Salinicoccus roseus]OZT76208.1 hypothetical protein CFN03_12800 [Salinicoccus roseus]